MLLEWQELHSGPEQHPLPACQCLEAACLDGFAGAGGRCQGACGVARVQCQGAACWDGFAGVRKSGKQCEGAVCWDGLVGAVQVQAPGCLDGLAGAARVQEPVRVQ